METYNCTSASIVANQLIFSETSGNNDTLQALCDGWTLSIRSIVEGDEKTTKRTDYSLADWVDDTKLGSYTGWGVYEKSFDLQLHPQQDWVLDLGIVGQYCKNLY